jgi:hypothetical protein
MKKINRIVMFDPLIISKLGQFPISDNINSNQDKGEIKMPYFIKFSNATRPLETT